MIEILNTNLGYVKTHTRLTVRSIEWDRNNRLSDYLLRGEELSSIREWLEQNEELEPKPSELHTRYIFASIKQQQLEESEQIQRQKHEIGQIKRQQQLIELQLESRNYLAREFMDGYWGMIANFNLHIEIVQRLLDRDPSRVLEELKSLQQNASTVFRGVTTLTRRLQSHHSLQSAKDQTHFESLLRGFVRELGAIYQRKVESNIKITNYEILHKYFIVIILEIVDTLFNSTFYLDKSRAVNIEDEDKWSSVTFSLEVTSEKTIIMISSDVKPYESDTLKTWLEVCNGKIEIMTISDSQHNIIVTIPMSDSQLSISDSRKA